VYTGRDESLRHATWLELFFDLVFVVALAELGSYLHDHLTVLGLLQFAGLFAIVWWIWLTISYFADTYNMNDPMSVAMVILAMFGVVFLSQTIHGALVGGSFAFALAVFILRGFLTASHLRARALRDHLPASEEHFLTYWIGLEVLVTVVWGLSLLVPAPGRYGLWVASFVLGVAGMTTIYLNFKHIIAPSASHCSERLGLFTILVLGETILAVSVGISLTVLTPMVLVASALGFVVAVAAWWLYFGHYDERVYERTLLARTKHWTEQRQRGVAHVYAHVFVHAGIVVAGVGTAVMLEAAFSHHALPVGGRVALCLGLAAFLLGSGISQWMAPASLDGRAVAGRTSVVVVLALLAGFGGSLSPLALLAIVALTLVGLVVFEGLNVRFSLVPAPAPEEV
jgi:low temperature requirement protein LtrA